MVLANVVRMGLEIRKSHDGRQIRLEANGPGECDEDGMEIRETS